MIYRQPGGITFPPTLLPPSRGIACIVSCGGMERTSEAETKRERRERKSSIYFRGEKRRRKSEGKKDLLSLSRKSLFFPRLYTVFTYVNARNGGRKSGTTSFAFVPTIILMNYRRPLSRLVLPSNSHRNSTLSLSLSFCSSLVNLSY